MEQQVRRSLGSEMSVSSDIGHRPRMSCPFLEATAFLAAVTATKPVCPGGPIKRKPLLTLDVSPSILFPAYIDIVMNTHLFARACALKYARSGARAFPGHKVTDAKQHFVFLQLKVLYVSSSLFPAGGNLPQPVGNLSHFRMISAN